MSNETGSTNSTCNQRTLYVGNLDAEVTEVMLFNKFQTLGDISSIRICRDFNTRRSLGYAYINFQNEAGAKRVLESLNYEMLNGRPMRIMWPQRDPWVRKSGIGNIFVRNLDKNINEKWLYDNFIEFGNILSCKIMTNASGESRGFGFIQYENEESCKNAVQRIDGMTFFGKKIHVAPFLKVTERQPQTPKKRPSNIFIKNFGDLLDDEKLKSMFEPFGTILSCLVMKDENGNSKGFGFCCFENEDDAKKAIEHYRDFHLEDRKLCVLPFKNKAEKTRENQSCNIYVKNLDDSIDDAKLKDIFSRFGTITSARVIVKDEISRGFGFVKFSTPEEANRAIVEMKGFIIGSKPIYVAVAQNKEQRRAMLMQKFSKHSQPNNISPYNATTRSIYSQITNVPYPHTLSMSVRPQPRWQNRATMNQNVFHEYPQLNQSVYRTNQLRQPPSSILNPGFFTAYSNAERNIPTLATNLYPLIFTNEQIPLTATFLANLNPQMQKQILGERLFRLIQKFKIPQLASKITGMLLELDNSEILHLIESNDALRSKVDEAEACLQGIIANKLTNKPEN